MPNRIIKDSIHTSEKLNGLTDFQFRLWVGLLTYVDDYGRGDARPAVIKGLIFPLRDRMSVKDVSDALGTLAGIGCVNLYEVDGRPYLYFPTWEVHQNIRAKKSKYPAPEDGIITSEIICKRMQADDCKCPRNPIQSESNPNPNTNPRGADAPSVFEEFSSGDEKVLSALKEFEKMRKSIKKPLTDRAKELIILDLQKLTDKPTAWVEILNQSVLHSWQGVFPLKETTVRTSSGKSAPRDENEYTAQLAKDAGWLQTFTNGGGAG
jgi:hypothetical protein